MMAAAGRGAAWLLPAGRRDWVAALWAEAHEVPAGLARLAWRAGGIWMLAREALMPRRLGRAVMFAMAAAVAAWVAWPDSSILHAAADQFGVIATVLLLAGLPLLARRFFGPAGDSRTARFLRVGGYAAILALIPARAVVGPYPLNVPRQGPDLRVFIADGNSIHGLPGTSAGGPPWPGEIFFLVLTACYVVTIFWLTSRQASAAPATMPWPALAWASLTEPPGLRQYHLAASTPAATGPPNSRIHASATNGSTRHPGSHGLVAYCVSPSGATTYMTRPNTMPTPVPAASVAGAADACREVSQKMVTT